MEHHGDIAAANGAHGSAVAVQARQVDGRPAGVPVARREQDRARVDAAAGRQDAQDGPGRDALAAAALAHEPERTVGPHVEIEAVHGLHGSFLEVEPNVEAAYFYQVFHVVSGFI